MNYLVDANILSRLAEPGHSMHRPDFRPYLGITVATPADVLKP